ncbi:MAG: aminotransferase class I/II-fold pyridoxal phosphate-dependent enzyme [Candidatus Acidiferrales bacterium]
MNQPRSMMHSAYMEWAKTRARTRFDLATSGLASYPLAELPVRLEDLELSAPGGYGYEPLQRRLAARSGAPVECVVAATGTSLANHLAMTATLEPSDEILIEHPTYELLVTTARYLGAEVRRFPRRFEDGFRLDPGEVERCVTPRTRLIVVTNLHNPSGALADEHALEQIGEIARSAGARVLVDEVYLDAAALPLPRSAFHLGEHFLATSSLTKVYGLSGLRCGWVLAEPALARRMWRLQDLYEVIPAHPAERLSVIAIDHLDRIAARARALLDANRRLLDRFLDSRSDLQAVKPAGGTTAFPQLLRGSVEALCTLLHEKYETSVVPGRFFELPEHFRIGIGGETPDVAAGLERLAAALDELAASRTGRQHGATN